MLPFQRISRNFKDFNECFICPISANLFTKTNIKNQVGDINPEFIFVKNINKDGSLNCFVNSNIKPKTYLDALHNKLNITIYPDYIEIPTSNCYKDNSIESNLSTKKNKLDYDLEMEYIDTYDLVKSTKNNKIKNKKKPKYNNKKINYKRKSIYSADEYNSQKKINNLSLICDLLKYESKKYMKIETEYEYEYVPYYDDYFEVKHKHTEKIYYIGTIHMNFLEIIDCCVIDKYFDYFDSYDTYYEFDKIKNIIKKENKDIKLCKCCQTKLDDIKFNL